MPDANISYSASGTIMPSRFVTAAAGSAGRCAQAVAGSRLLGVSQEGSFNAPGLRGITSFPAAEDGMFLKVYGDLDSAILIVGGTVSAGDYLKADANGFGVVATAGELYGARALEPCVSGGPCRVQVKTGF